MLKKTIHHGDTEGAQRFEILDSKAKKLFGNPMTAPKGRNIIAWGIAPGREASLFIKALKGRNSMSPLQGLL
jgi:hypothetical protein